MGRLKAEAVLIPDVQGTPKVVQITWVDAESCSEYKDTAMVYQVGIEQQDVGFLVYESKSWVVLAQEFVDDPPRFRRTISIPQVAVVKRKELRG